LRSPVVALRVAVGRPLRPRVVRRPVDDHVGGIRLVVRSVSAVNAALCVVSAQDVVESRRVGGCQVTVVSATVASMGALPHR